MAEVFVTHFPTKFGAPKFLHTEQGATFDSQLFAEICKLLGVKKTGMLLFHPQSDRIEERLKCKLGSLVAVKAEDHPKTQDEQLPLLTKAYRATPQNNMRLVHTSCSDGK